MSREKRCPYCWDTGDPMDQGGSAARGYDVCLIRCENHTEREDIPPYLHLWDEAQSLNLNEYKKDWEFTKKVHSIFFHALSFSHDEFQWSCAGEMPNLKQDADQLAEAFKTMPIDKMPLETTRQFVRKVLLKILGIKEGSREDEYIKLAVEYYCLFLGKAGLAHMERRKMRPFRSFECHLLLKEIKQLGGVNIISTDEYE